MSEHPTKERCGKFLTLLLLLLQIAFNLTSKNFPYAMKNFSKKAIKLFLPFASGDLSEIAHSWMAVLLRDVDDDGRRVVISSFSTRVVFSLFLPSPRNDGWKENFLYFATAPLRKINMLPHLPFPTFPSLLLARYYLKCTSNYFNSLEYDFLH